MPTPIGGGAAGGPWWVLTEAPNGGEVVQSPNQPPGALGPYTKAEADQVAGNVAQPLTGPAGGEGAAALAKLNPVHDLNSFLKFISNRHFITRAAEVVLGGLLVVIALNQFLGKPAQKAAGAAVTAAKVAAK